MKRTDLIKRLRGLAVFWCETGPNMTGTPTPKPVFLNPCPATVKSMNIWPGVLFVC